VAHDVPVVTTTSVLSVTEVAAALANPSRCAGLHFFTPPPAHRTIEVVRAMQSDDEVVRRHAAHVDELDDKIAVIVEDRPGFLINAMLMPYLNDVIQEFDDDLATAEDIDVALQLGLGYKTGPLQMLDRIGLDVHLRATQAAFDATGDSRYNPPPLLRRMVASGHLGNKNGLGFRVNQDTDHKSNNEEKD
jgi:3-hydroxybutyryl-CoA dehydrogenase